MSLFSPEGMWLASVAFVAICMPLFMDVEELEQRRLEREKVKCCCECCKEE